MGKEPEKVGADDEQAYLVAPKAQQRRARSIPWEERIKILLSYKETELHKYIKLLYHRMDPDLYIEVTHGTQELGKDLVSVLARPHDSIVTAYVVKKMTIRGETAGSVDEIQNIVEKIQTNNRVEKELESQIKQAFGHEAQTKYVFKDLRVSRVIVLLFGTLSNSARQRLVTENVKWGPVDAKDIKWLVEQFTDYYPSIFLTDTNSSALESKINLLESCDWKLGKKKCLSQYYISPAIRSITIEGSREKATVTEMYKSAQSLPGDFFSKLSPNEIHILFGESGVGKTATMVRACIKSLEDAMFRKKDAGPSQRLTEVLVYLTVRDLPLAELAPDLLNHFFEEEVSGLSIKAILLDGLDDCTDDKQAILFGKASAMAQRHECALVVAYRKPTFDFFYDSGEVQLAELLPFEFGQALELLKRLVPKGSRMDLLRDGLKKIVGRIPLVPLSLVLLVEIIEDRRELPASVSELYTRFIDIALGAANYEKGLEVLFEYRIKKSYLSILAFQMFFLRDRIRIPVEDFESHLAQYADQKYSNDSVKKAQFQEGIRHSGLLDFMDGVSFLHRSFLDYFIAWHINTNQNLNVTIAKEPNVSAPKRMAELYFDPLWSEVVLFFYGLRSEMPLDVVSEVFSRGEVNDDDSFSKFCFGRILQAAWNSDSEVKQEGIRQGMLAAESALDFIEKHIPFDKKKSSLYPLYMLMGIADYCYGSYWLKTEILTVLSSEIVRTDRKSQLRCALLLYSVHKQVDQTELTRLAAGLIQSINNNKPDATTELALLTAMRSMLKNQSKLSKRIDRRVYALRGVNDPLKSFVAKLFLGRDGRNCSDITYKTRLARRRKK